MDKNTEWILERKLQYSPKGKDELKEFSVRISKPYRVDQKEVNFDIGEDGFSACKVYVCGDDFENSEIVYGFDDMQAVHIASNSEPRLRRLSKKYDLFLTCGYPYFDKQ